MTFNQRAFIETCLRSILEQEVEGEVRALVGDDASDDGTSDIVRSLVAEFGDRLQHLRHEANVGALENMRALMMRAKGDYVARVDGDDYWLPGKLARQLRYLQENPGCSAVYTNAITIDEAGRRIGLFNDLGDARIDLRAMVRRGNVLNNSSVLFRHAGTAAWNEGGQIDYRIHLWQARYGWLGHIGQPLAAYRVGTSGSLVHCANEHVRKLYWQAIQSVPRELISDGDYARGITDFLRRVCFRGARNRDWALVRRWTSTVFAASPYSTPRTMALLLANIGRMGAKIVGARLRGRGAPHILYRH